MTSKFPTMGTVAGHFGHTPTPKRTVVSAEELITGKRAAPVPKDKRTREVSKVDRLREDTLRSLVDGSPANHFTKNLSIRSGYVRYEEWFEALVSIVTMTNESGNIFTALMSFTLFLMDAGELTRRSRQVGISTPSGKLMKSLNWCCVLISFRSFCLALYHMLSQVPSVYHYASLLQIAAEALGGVAIGSAIIETAPEYFLAGYDRWQLKLAVWTLQALLVHAYAKSRLRTLRETGRGGVATVNMVETIAFFFAFAIGEGNAKTSAFQFWALAKLLHYLRLPESLLPGFFDKLFTSTQLYNLLHMIGCSILIRDLSVRSLV